MLVRDWRTPSARFRARLRAAACEAISFAGRYDRKSPAEKQTVGTEDIVPFFGDRPGDRSGFGFHTERRLAYAVEPPESELHKDVYYSRDGMAWFDGALHEKHSIRSASVREMITAPDPHSVTDVDVGTIVESENLHAYGDWVYSYLGILLSAKELQLPLLLPTVLALKDYVRRDLELAGIKYREVSGWVRIRNATVLRKRHPGLFWSRRQVDAFQRAFAPERPLPRPGSILYLARPGLVGEMFARTYPSDAVAEVVRAHGGEVVQSGISPATAHQFANQAETVIADHGSACLNVMFWRPLNFIEIYVNDWWSSCFMLAAHFSGARNLFVFDGLRVDQLLQNVEACLANRQTETQERDPS